MPAVDTFAKAMHIDIGCQLCAFTDIRESRLKEEISDLESACRELSQNNVEHRAALKSATRSKRALRGWLGLFIALEIVRAADAAGWIK